MASRASVLFWFGDDLRLFDHPALRAGATMLVLRNRSAVSIILALAREISARGR